MRCNSMTELQRLKRAIDLKRQSVPLIRSEIIGMEERFILIRMQTRLESEMGVDFDPALSRKLGCIDFLLNN